MLTETYVRGDLAVHRGADGDEVCCERVRTSDASGYISQKLRHVHQLLPDTFGSTGKGDTMPRARALDPRSRLWPGVDGEETLDGEHVGLPDKTSAATLVIEEDDFELRSNI